MSEHIAAGIRAFVLTSACLALVLLIGYAVLLWRRGDL